MQMRAVLCTCLLSVGLLTAAAAAADTYCWFLAGPQLSADGSKIETHLSLSTRVKAHLANSNATSISIDVKVVPVDALSQSGGKDVWSQALNRYNVRWESADQSDRNDMGYRSGIEAVSKTWALFVQYSTPVGDCLPFQSNAPAGQFVAIPFGQVPGISDSDTQSNGAGRDGPTPPLSIVLILCCAAAVTNRQLSRT